MPMLLAPGTIIDRYLIQEVLGEGGLAIVYHARHTQLDTDHAIKVLKNPSPAIRKRLLLEGKVQAKLQHPNIVAVTDVVDIDGAPGLVMEYVAGFAIDEYLQRYKLSVEQADVLGRGILNAMRAAHAQGLIHRDLKPANILLKPEGNFLIPKVTDFGLAKILAHSGSLSRTRSGVAMGTPSYMAPEQIRDAKNVDQRADVFALGAILYELLTGEQAFPGEDLLEIFNAVATANYVPVTERIPDLPRRMVDAIEAALQVDLDVRLKTTDDLLELWEGGTPAPTDVWTGSAMQAGLRPQSPRVQNATTTGADQVYAYADADGNVGRTDTYNSGKTFGIQPTEAPAKARQASPAADTLLPVIAAANPPARNRLLLPGALLLLAIFVGFGSIGLGAVMMMGLSSDSNTPLPVPVEQPTPPVLPIAPTPSPEPATPEPKPKPEPEPIAAPSPVPSPTPVKPISQPSPSPEPSKTPIPTPVTTGRVVVKGETPIRLLGAAGTFTGGEVPAGTYRLIAQFKDENVEHTEPVEIVAGKTLTIKCNPGFYTCAVH